MKDRRPIQITIRLPDKALSPNARKGWRSKYWATRRYRELAAMVAMETGRKPMWDRAEQSTVFYHKDRRNRDGDNHLAMLKPVWDGLQDAGVLADDSGLTHHPVTFGIDKHNPRVEITLEPVGEVSDG